MNFIEFEKQPRGPYHFDRWSRKRPVLTPLGPFAVELQMLGDGDTNPPDNEMLRRGSELVTYAESHGEYLLDIVFGYYLLACEDPDWLESCGVPRGLTRGTVASFLRQHRSLVVSRHLSWSKPYSRAIFVVPLWDEEHALNLDFCDGSIVAENESEFKLDSDVLRWLDT
jgi:hypothetical protein